MPGGYGQDVRRWRRYWRDSGSRNTRLRYAERTFNQEFYLDASAEVESISETEAGVEIRYRHRDGHWETESFKYVLAATGRAPNVAKLGLENSGLPLDEHGVPDFNRLTLQCGNSSIFIAGDASNDIPLLHEATDQGRIAGDNAGRYPDIRPGFRRTPLSIVFSEPQLMVVWVPLENLERQYLGHVVLGQASFEDQGRSRIMLRNNGVLKVYAERGSGLFLGAEMFGPAAEHVGHLLAWAVQRGLTVGEMLEMPFYHPVIEEGGRSALRDLKHRMSLASLVMAADVNPQQSQGGSSLK